MSRSIRSERLGVFWSGIAVAHGPQSGRAPVLRFAALLLLLSLLSEHPDHIVKSLFDIDTVLGRGLDEFASQILGESLTFLGGYGSFDGLVTLVPHQHHGHGQRGARGSIDGRGQVAGTGGRPGVGGLLDHLDLIVEFLYPGKRGSRGDAVDEDEALTVADPLIAQGRVFFLAGGIQHLQHT